MSVALGAESGTKTHHPVLFPACVDGKWGYIDADGTLKIEPRFLRASDFSEGLGRVWSEKECSFVNASGDEVATLPLSTQQLDWVGDFSDGLAWFSTWGKCGCINRRGEIVIKPSFDDAERFTNGLAKVNIGATVKAFPYRHHEGGRWGFINANGRMVIPPRFTSAESFSEQLALVSDGDDLFFVDTRGIRLNVQNPTVRPSNSFSDGLAPFVTSRDGRSGFIDRDGKTVVAARYDAVMPFSEGLAAVKVSNKWGFIDKQAITVIRAEFDSVRAFHEGFAGVEQNGHWSFIDKHGNSAIQKAFVPAGGRSSFNDVDDFSRGLARVHIGGVFERGYDGPAKWTAGAWYYVNTRGFIVGLCRTDEDAGPGYGKEFR